MRVRTLIGCLMLVTVLIPVGPAAVGQNVLTWTDKSSNEQNFDIERKAEAYAGGATVTPTLGAVVLTGIAPSRVVGTILTPITV